MGNVKGMRREHEENTKGIQWEISMLLHQYPPPFPQSKPLAPMCTTIFTFPTLRTIMHHTSLCSSTNMHHNFAFSFPLCTNMHHQFHLSTLSAPICTTIFTFPPFSNNIDHLLLQHTPPFLLFHPVAPIGTTIFLFPPFSIRMHHPLHFSSL